MADQDPTTKPIRVLLWSPRGAGLHYGGPGMTAYRLYAKARPGRFEVTLAHGYPEQEPYDLFEQIHEITPLDGSKPSQWRFCRTGAKWVADAAERFDVMHGLQGFHLTVGPALAAQRAGLPSVVKIAAHQSDLADKAGWKRLLGMPRRRRRMLHDIGAVIAISRDIADELLSYGIPDSKIARIPNGVDTKLFQPVADQAERAAIRSTLGWPDMPTILFTGGLNQRKRPLLIVEAVGLLKKKGIDCRLVMAGPRNDGAYEDLIQCRVAELKIGDRVERLGFTKDVAPLYRASDVFCLPSSNEGMPNAVLEAMACGLPVVVTAISGTRDLMVDGKHGRFVEPVPDSLAESIGEYISNPNVREEHGGCARRHVSRYSAESVLDAHEALFRQLMAGRPVRS